MSSVIVRINKMPAIKQIIANPIINKEELFSEEMISAPKTVNISEYNEFTSSDLMYASSSASIVILTKADKENELREIIELHLDDKKSCSAIKNRKIKCSA